MEEGSAGTQDGSKSQTHAGKHKQLYIVGTLGGYVCCGDGDSVRRETGKISSEGIMEHPR